MKLLKKEHKNYYLLFFLGILCGVLCFFNNRVNEIAQSIIFFCTTSYYFFLIIYWMYRLTQKVNNKRMMHQFFFAGIFMLVLLTARTLRYRIFTDFTSETVSRQLWYFYSFANVFIPLHLFLGSLYIGKDDSYVISKKWTVLFLPALAIVLIVLTNDFHQIAYQFNEGMVNWNSEYTRGPIIVLISVWFGVFTFLSYGIIFLQAIRNRSAKRFIIPFVLTVLCVLYYISIFAVDYHHPYNYPEWVCLSTLLVYESMFQLHLIRSNLRYEYFFSHLSVPSFVSEKNGQVKYTSENMPPVPYEKRLDAKSHPVLLDKDHLLVASEVSNATFYHIEDLTFINKINEELNGVNALLHEQNDLIFAEQELKKKSVRIQKRNEVNQIISRMIEEPSSRIDKLLNDLDADSLNYAEAVKEADFSLAYIKRIINLIIISMDEEYISMKEMDLSVNELMKYLSFMEVDGAFSLPQEEKMEKETAIELFHVIYEEIYKRLFHISSVFIRVSMENEEVTLHMMCGDKEGNDISYSLRIGGEKDE